MKRISWKWLLPIALLAFALACHVYDPHEYRVQARLDHAVDNLEYLYQNNPSIYGRISLGINFPALVLDYPFREIYNPRIYESNDNDMFISIAPKDIGFFCGILLFWYWVGWTLDKSLGGIRGTWPRPARIAGLCCGLIFGMLTAVYAEHMVTLEFRPWRQIGAFGIAWAAVLIAYFTWRLTHEFGAGRKVTRGFPQPSS